MTPGFAAPDPGYPCPVTRFGYTLMTEQSGPKDLVRYAAAAEDAGFDLLVSSDHYFPWLSAQGHSPTDQPGRRLQRRVSPATGEQRCGDRHTAEQACRLA